MIIAILLLWRYEKIVREETTDTPKDLIADTVLFFP